MFPQTGPFVLFDLPSGLPEMWQSLAVVFTEHSPKACILLASERPEVLRIQENLVRTLPIPVLVFWENNFLQNPRVERCQDTLSMATHACGNVVDSIESRDRAENLWGIRTACISARTLFENVPLLEALPDARPDTFPEILARLSQEKKRAQTGGVPYIPDIPPPDLYHGMVEAWQVAKRLEKLSYEPGFIIDAGCSTGIWSDTMARVFPNSVYVLVDPLYEEYPKNARDYYSSRLKTKHCFNCALTGENGTRSFFRSSNLYNSSLFSTVVITSSETVSVACRTLDSIAEQLGEQLPERGILKADVQLGELEVLKGAMAVCDRLDFIILETTLFQVDEAPDMVDVLLFMREFGFELHDVSAGWRTPESGQLYQCDLVFRAKGKFMPSFESNAT